MIKYRYVDEARVINQLCNGFLDNKTTTKDNKITTYSVCVWHGRFKRKAVAKELEVIVWNYQSWKEIQVECLC